MLEDTAADGEDAKVPKVYSKHCLFQLWVFMKVMFVIIIIT